MSERVESSSQERLIAALDRQTVAIGQLVAVVADLLANLTDDDVQEGVRVDLSGRPL